MSARDPLRNALPLLIEAAERYVNQAGRWPVGTNARARQDAYLAEISQALANAREALAAVPAEPERNGVSAAWVCDRCGQPIGREDRCNSGLHVGPGEGANGVAVASTDLVAERDALRAEVKRLRPAEPEAWEWRAVVQAAGRVSERSSTVVSTSEDARATLRSMEDAWVGGGWIERRRPGTAPGEWERVDPEPLAATWRCPGCGTEYTRDVGECGQRQPSDCRERVERVEPRLQDGGEQ